MRILLAIVLAAAAAWAGYWFIGSSTVRSEAAAWFDARRADGWTAGYSNLSVHGFPNRFDSSFTDIELNDPQSGLGWQAPFFQLLTLSYTPNHLIAVWPHEQKILTPENTYRLNSSDMRASLVLGDAPTSTPIRSTLTSEGLALIPEHGFGAMSLASLRLAAERSEDALDTGHARYHLGLAAKELALPVELLAQLDPNGTAARVIETLNADVTVDFTMPWSSFTIEEARPQPTRLEIKHISVVWGGMTLDAAGSLDINASGIADGTIVIKAHDWHETLKLAEASGALDPGIADTVRQILTAMASASDDQKTLETALKFAGGRIWLGALPVANVSPMIIR